MKVKYVLISYQLNKGNVQKTDQKSTSNIYITKGEGLAPGGLKFGSVFLSSWDIFHVFSAAD